MALFDPRTVRFLRFENHSLHSRDIHFSSSLHSRANHNGRCLYSLLAFVKTIPRENGVDRLEEDLNKRSTNVGLSSFSFSGVAISNRIT